MGLKGLKAKRMLMGLTQQDISKKIGIACKTYNFKENGRKRRANRLSKFCLVSI